MAVVAVLAMILATLVVVTQFSDSQAGPGSLLLVTDDGGTTGRNGDLDAYLAGLGWTVTVIDDDAAGLATAASGSDVVFVAGGTTDVGVDAIRALAVPIVLEELDSANNLFYEASATTSSNCCTTSLSIVDDTNTITIPLGVGGEELFTTGQTLSGYSQVPPAGVGVLATSPFDSNRRVLMVADTGAALASGNTAAERRVTFLTDGSAVSSWNTTMQDTMERAIDWAASASELDGRPDLLFVTGDGTAASGDDAARRSFFESDGWDVRVIDDDAGLPALSTAASAADVMYVSETTAASFGTTARGLDIGIVAEDVSNWRDVMYGATSSLGSTSATSVNVTDNTLFPTSSFSTGTLTTAPAATTHSFWRSDVVALPAGARELVALTGDVNHEFLIAFEAGSTMYSANTAADRRVLGGWANAPVANWGTNLETMVQRSLRWAAGMLVVNSTGDGPDISTGDGFCDTGLANSAGDDECTLRAAIQETASTATVERIVFDLPTTEAGHASGTWTISPTSVLPDVSATVDLLADTQAGWSGDPIVAVDATSIGAGNDALTLSGTGASIRGLAILNAPDDGISLAGGGGHTVAGNWVGLAFDGSTTAGAGDDGIDIAPGSAGNVVGGPNVADRNVVAASGSDGIIDEGTATLIEGNYVGTDSTGLLDRGNTLDGISLVNSISTVVRGNIASGNGDEGISIDNSDGAVIVGNVVGLGADRSTPIGNTDEGIDLENTASADVTIGGTDASDGNLIAHNGQHGVRVGAAGSVRNTILGNQIFANGGLAIDLGGDDAVTENDVGDGDTGSNDLLNFPVITGNSLDDVEFDLDVPAGDYLVEAFRNPSGNDATGNGEGEVSLGTHQIAHTGSGLESFTGSFTGVLSSGDVTMTITACDDGTCTSFGSTSEFSDASTPSAPTQALVMVTGDGTTTGTTKDSALAALFTGWGWTVTAIDDQSTATAFSTAATNNHVMFVSDSAANLATAAVRDLDIGLVNEAFSQIPALLHAATSDENFTSQTTLSLVDDTHPITTGFSAGSLTIHTASADVNYWDESATPLPAGVAVLADSPTSSAHGALFVADTGAALYSSNTAVNRRVWFPSDASSPSVWTSDYETLLERSLLWAAGEPTGVDPVGHWRFDEQEGTTAIDSSPSGNDGTIAGPARYVGGVSNTSLGFFGTASSVEVPDPSGEELDRSAGADLTVAAWVRLDDELAAFTAEPIAVKADFGNDPAINGYELVVFHDGASTGLYFKLWDDAPIDQSSGVTQVMDTTTNWSDGRWRHVVGIVRGSSLELWVEGVLIQSIAHSAGDLSNSEPLRFGGSWSPTSSFDGAIDEVMIWNRALSSTEIVAASTAAGHIVTVNSTGDASDASAGDGACATGATNVAGDPECTIRAAIQEANAHGTIDTVHFSIPEALTSGEHVITPNPELNDPTDRIVIDGTTEADASSGAVVVLDGGSAGFLDNGLALTAGADGSEIRGLVVRNWGSSGLEVLSGNDGSTIAGNFVGRLTAAGTDSGAGTENGGSGIWVRGTNTTVGGPLARDRNVISGNDDAGVFVEDEGADGNVVENNTIGLLADGTSLRGNGADGITISTGADDTHIIDNLIAHPGGDGIEVAGASTGTIIQGNTIGTDAGGSADFAGRFAGVSLSGGADRTLIGGVDVGDGNVIAHAGTDGGNPNTITIESDAGPDNAVLGNELRDSNGIAIDLGLDGGTANDPGDADSGPNGLLNTPIVTDATETAGTITVTYDLDVPTNSDLYRVEFFTNPSGANAVGAWEAEQIVAATTTGPGVGLTHSFVGSAADVVTASVTRIASSLPHGFGATSEVSPSFVVTAAVDVVTAVDDVVAASPGFATGLDLAANDDDPNGDAIVVVDATDPVNGTVTTNGDGTVTYTSTPAYVGPDSFDYWAIDAGTPLAHYWGLAGDGVDAAGSADGTVNGAATVAGSFGDALSFDEVDDHVVVPDLAYASERTITFDFKLDDNSGSGFKYLYSHGDINGVNSVNVFVAESSQGTDPNMLRTVLRDADDSLDNFALQFDVSSIVGDGQWHTYAVTSGPDGLRVFLDGVEMASDATRGSGSLDPAGSLILGGRQDLNASRYYGGSLDTVQIHDRDLAPHELSALAAGTNTATVSMTVTSGAETYFDQFSAVALDGSDGTIDWSGTPWIEQGEADGLAAGRARIVASGGCLSGNCINIGGDSVSLTGRGWARPVDLSDAATATWTHFVTTTGSGADLAAEVSTNGGASWTTLESSPVAGAKSYDITAFAGPDTWIRIVGSGTSGSDVQWYVDDVQVEFTRSNVVVNSTDDDADANPGDDRCDTGGTNADGDHECTLRAAIEEANASAAITRIDVAIPATDGGHAAGIWTIGPGDQLPVVTAPAVIDATTQTGWTSTPVVEVDGTAAGAADGFEISGSNVEIRGFAINRFAGDGVKVLAGSTGGVLIAGNHIGLDPSGLVDRGNGGRGIDLQAGSGPTTIGGSTAADRNVISGNAANGVVIGSTDANVIIGNYVGTDVSGNASATGIGNGLDGIFLAGTAANNVIGQAGAGNVVSGNAEDGIETNATGANNSLHGNHIGVGADGTTPLGNGRHGIVLYDGVNNTRIGGSAAGEGNVISANTQEGVHLNGNGNAATSDNVIEGNLIGTDATGTLDRGNGTEGIDLFGGANSTTIGGAAAGAGNTIAFNGAEGVAISDAGSVDNSVLANSIHSNGSLGIDLEEDGHTPNDPSDVDAGPNDLLNHPLLAVPGRGEAALSFTLDAPAGDYRIEVYSNPTDGADASGYGEGERLLDAATITHTGSGVEDFTIGLATTFVGGDEVSATATEDLGGGSFGATSEFSQAVAVPAGVAVTDRSQARHDLVAQGGLDASSPGAGVADGGIDLGGGSQRLGAPAGQPAPTAFTLSGWVNATTLTGEAALVAQSAPGSAIVHELLADGATGEAVARLRVGGSTIEARGGSVGTSAWHQLAATYDGADLTLFVDGTEVDRVAAVGTVTIDLDLPVTIGNVSTGASPVNGSVDHVTVAGAVRSAAWLQTEYLNLSDPAGMVAIGAEQASVAGAWSTTTGTTRTGSHALQAPTTTGGASPWAVISGLDEPGLAFESWWFVSDPSTSGVAAGTNTGLVPTDQRETRANAAGFDLAALVGATRTVDATDASTVSPSTWTRVEIRTDETGTSSVWIDGVQVIAPTAHAAGTSGGSAGLRVDTLPGGASWFVDDVLVRRLVSDEPTTSLGPLHRS